MNPGDPYGLLGQVLDGQFRVDRFVGEGGFSVVYRGHHIGLDEPIAIKCLKLPTTLGSALVESFVRRFRDESRLHYRLSQGDLAIVRSIASGTTISPTTSALVPYMVLEWLEGRSLAQDFDARKQQGLRGRSLAEVVRLLDTAAQGLAYAHAQGVVHRDINPGNVFLAETRQGPMAKVLDFGVAKVISDHALELGPRAQTIGHIRIFAPAYGAPEQFDDTVGKVGPASDVYSFSLIVLEALRDDAVRAGEHIGEFAMTALDASKKPTPRALGIPVGDAVEEVLARAVAMRPEDRWADAGELWGALKNAIRRDQDSGRPPHADAAAPATRPTAWKPHAPAAGQPASAHDRGVTADMPAPIVELARPGSIAPVAPLAGDAAARLSRPLQQTVRMAHVPTPAPGPAAPMTSASGGAASALGATPLTSTLMMDNVARPALPAPPPAVAAGDGAVDASPMAHSLMYGAPPNPSPPVYGSPAPPQYGPPPGASFGTPAPAPANVSQPVVVMPAPSRADIPTVVPPKPKASAATVAMLVFVMIVVAAAAGFGVYRVIVARHAAAPGTSPAAMDAPTPTLTSASVAGNAAPPIPPVPPVPAAAAPEPTAPVAAADPTPPPAATTPPPRPLAPPAAAPTPVPASPVSTASPSAPVAPGAFDPKAARAALDVMDGVLASCRTRGGKSGDGTISVTFNPDGKVARAVVDEPPFLGTPEGQCVASRFKAAKMAPFVGAPGTLVYTFHVPK